MTNTNNGCSKTDIVNVGEDRGRVTEMTLLATHIRTPKNEEVLGGTLVFCTNLRRFKLDAAAMPGLDFEDITRRTIPRDFAGNPRIHSAWIVRHRPQETA